jgi:hypothetical protein
MQESVHQIIVAKKRERKMKVRQLPVRLPSRLFTTQITIQDQSMNETAVVIGFKYPMV